jgi:hypothetical protein
MKNRIETSAGLTELSGTELDLVAGGVVTTPAPPPTGGSTAVAVGALASNSASVSQANAIFASNFVWIRH